MKTTIFIAFCIIALISCNSKKESTVVLPTVLSETDLIEKGEYLVKMMGCEDCHSTKTITMTGIFPDSTKNLGGHFDGDLSKIVAKEALANWVLFNLSSTAAVGPWGISYAANISSDATGIGTWNYEQFLKAFKEGKYKGIDNQRMLLPPMPWQNFVQIKDEDSRALFSYLKSTKPINNVVPLAVSPDGM